MGAKALPASYPERADRAERKIELAWLTALFRRIRAAKERHFFYHAERNRLLAQRHAERLACRYPPPFRF